MFSSLRVWSPVKPCGDGGPWSRTIYLCRAWDRGSHHPSQGTSMQVL